MDKSFTDALNAVANFVGGIDTLIAHSFGASTALVAQRDLGTSVNKQVLVNTFDRCHWLVEEFAKDIGASHSVVRAMREKMAAPYGGDIDWNRVPLTDMLAISNSPYFTHSRHDRRRDHVSGLRNPHFNWSTYGDLRDTRARTSSGARRLRSSKNVSS
jgi:pimeloyl-ACP methyl ester carboxylesterase